MTKIEAPGREVIAQDHDLPRSLDATCSPRWPVARPAVLLRARPGAVLILDGTLIVTDRVAERAYYSGKHKHYGVNVQQFTDGTGAPIWSGPRLAGGTHDLTAIRATGLLPTLDWLARHGVVVLADKGY